MDPRLDTSGDDGKKANAYWLHVIPDKDFEYDVKAVGICLAFIVSNTLSSLV